MLRNRFKFSLTGLACLAVAIAPTPAVAQGVGDLLVAPTRLELNNFRGTEVFLNNIGSAKATYRISAELRRMTPDGELEDVDPAQATELQKKVQEMIVFAPRRITLEPNQPQSIRVGVRPPPDLPDGEYRVHLLFRAIPEPRPPQDPDPQGISIDLRAVYGVTIPVFARRGQLSAEAGIVDARLTTEEGHQAVAVTLTRTGNRSLYGDVLLIKPGRSEPVITTRGVAIYTEVDRRGLVMYLPKGSTEALAGPATIRYVERTDDGARRTLAETNVVLR